jgi:DNA topoisomerase II
MSKHASGKWLNPFQQALLRPDTYIGSCETHEEVMFVYENDAIVRKKISYNHGLLQLPTETLSNAIDNKWSSDQEGVKMTYIQIEVDKETGRITITNDGLGIPIVKHSYEYKDPITGKVTNNEMYPAELYFGYMLTSTNYDDNQKRKTSGRNGMGAKAAGVFSTLLEVEHVDVEQHKKFVQRYEDHYETRSEPEITRYPNKTSYTKISFIPDYQYFSYPGLDEDLVSLLHKMAYDCAMITGLAVYFNEEKIVIKSLAKYVQLYYPKANMMALTHGSDEALLVEINTTTEVFEDRDLANMAFVNGVWTKKGGVHVDVWRDTIIGQMVKSLNTGQKKKKERLVQAKVLYPYFCLFLRCEVDKPKFDSQTKDYLTKPTPTTRPFTEDELKKVLKWPFVADLREKLATLDTAAATRKVRIHSGKKLLLCRWAGKKAEQCCLFITEGLSAMTMAKRGIESTEHGLDRMSIFAIKGKFPNIKTMTRLQLMKNEEVKTIVGVLNLEWGKDYSEDANFKTLTHQAGVVIMADQDDDGEHIRGLLLNFFKMGWPSLFGRAGFIRSFTTAVTKISLKKGEDIFFYSNPERKQWEREHPNAKMKTEPKYYKGIGSHRPEEIVEYFFEPKYVNYTDELEEDTEMMEVGFNDKKRDTRKEMIVKHMSPCSELGGHDFDAEAGVCTKTEGDMPLSEFISGRLIPIFFRADLLRMIPNMFDGFKEGARKVFYGISFTGTKSKGVENLIGDIKSTTGYHHAGKGLEEIIINMGRGFVGTNNIPLLTNDGEYGTRTFGGKDHAAPRYLFTCLEEVVATIFPKDHEELYQHLYDNKDKIEFEQYMPVIPMILINPSNGIACGFSTTIPGFDPEKVCEWILTWLKDERKVKKLAPLQPYFRGYKGTITLDQEKREWISRGSVREAKPGWLVIEELPVGVWTSKFMKTIIEWKHGSTEEVKKVGTKKPKKPKKVDKLLKDYDAQSTANSIKILLRPNDKFDQAQHLDPLLSNTHSLRNMVVIDRNGYPHRFTSAEELLLRMVPIYLAFFARLKQHKIDQATEHLRRETNRFKFVQEVLNGKLDMSLKEDDVVELLRKRKYDQLNQSFDYLLSMQMRSMNEDRLEKIAKEKVKWEAEVQMWNDKSDKEIWRERIEDFLQAYHKFLTTRIDEYTQTKKKRKSKKKVALTDD